MNEATTILTNTDITRRKNSNGSRNLIVNHLRCTLYSAYIKDIYEELTIYLRTILTKAAENGFEAGRIIGEHKIKLDAKSILEKGNWEEISEMISNSIFQSLESERSTLKLIKKISTKLSLNIDDELINEAIPYLEVRHFLVHNDGKLTQEFIDKYPEIRHNNGNIQLSYRLISCLKDAVIKLVAAFDKEVIDSNLLKDEDTQP